MYVFYVLAYAKLRYSGAWLVASTLMVFEFGSELLHGLVLAAGAHLPKETSLMEADQKK
jgi:hypothetical protein